MSASHVLEQVRAAAPISLPAGFIIVSRPDGSRFGRPTLAQMADLTGPAWDGTQMRVVELGGAA